MRLEKQRIGIPEGNIQGMIQPWICRDLSGKVQELRSSWDEEGKSRIRKERRGCGKRAGK